MGRGLNRLTAARARKLRTPAYYADGGCLYLGVAPGGSKGWIFRFTNLGRTRDAGLGSYPTVSLAKAREEAERYRRFVAAGIDPIEARRKEREAELLASSKAMTFEQRAKAFIAAHESSWKNEKHKYQWRAAFATYCYPIIGPLPVGSIDTALVMKVLDPIWSRKPETASRVRQRIERVLSWAKVRGYREGENPAQWRGRLDQLLPAKGKVRRVRHLAALPFCEIARFTAVLREDTSISARGLEFTILTAARTGEALGATWVEIDFSERMWVIPAARMKGRREHRVPLSGRAMAILRELSKIRRSEFVFPGAKQGRPLSQMAMLMLLRRMGYPHITVHGFRSSFRDWTAECTKFPREVAEMALAHAVSDAVEAAYRRGDMLERRRNLMEAWAKYCAREHWKVAYRERIA